VAVEARRVFSNTKEATYQHALEVDESKGVYNLDCSGFVALTLRNATPLAFSDLETGVAGLQGKPPKRPLAKHFVRYFEALEDGRAKSGKWLPLAKVTDLAQGDVIAWLMPPELESRNTGHVMLVRDAPRPSTLRSGEWVVPIIDSTSRKHGPTDSRAAGNRTGIGVGEIALTVDAEGRPTGYRWSPTSKAARSTQVAMARAMK
jgi:hypothetical protein